MCAMHTRHHNCQAADGMNEAHVPAAHLQICLLQPAQATPVAGGVCTAEPASHSQPHLIVPLTAWLALHCNRNMMPPPTAFLRQLVWALPPAALARHSVEEVVESAERQAARASLSYFAMPAETKQQVGHDAYAVQPMPCGLASSNLACALPRCRSGRQ